MHLSVIQHGKMWSSYGRNSTFDGLFRAGVLLGPFAQDRALENRQVRRAHQTARKASLLSSTIERLRHKLNRDPAHAVISGKSSRSLNLSNAAPLLGF